MTKLRGVYIVQTFELTNFKVWTVLSTDDIYGTICYYTTFKGSKCHFLHVMFSSLEAKPLGKLTFHQKDKILLSSQAP